MTGSLRPAQAWPLRHPFVCLAALCAVADLLVDGTTKSGFSAEAPVVFAVCCAIGLGLYMGFSKLPLPQRAILAGMCGCGALIFGGVCAIAHGAVVLLLAMVLTLLLVLLGGLLLTHKLDTQKAVFLLLCMGFCLRLAYVVYTSVTTRQHDVWYFANGSNKGHAGYIDYFYHGGSLWFGFDPRSHWQFYHPPLHHFTAAMWMRLHTWLSFSYERACEAVQILTLFYSCGATLVLVKIFRKLQLRHWGMVLATAVAAFHPSFIIFSGSINNDILSCFLQFAAVYCALRWYEQPTMGRILPVALCVGGSMLAKLSGVLCAPAIAVIFLYKWWKDRDETLEYFTQFACFALVCVPMGLGWSVLHLLAWGMPMAYVPVLGVGDNAQYVGMYSAVQRLFELFGDGAGSIYVCWGGDAGYHEYNIWQGLIKSSVFGEYTLFSAPVEGMTGLVWLKRAGGLAGSAVLSGLNWLCIGLSLAAGVRTLFKKNRLRQDALLTAVLWVLFGTTVLMYVRMCFGAPHTCTQNFRYTTPLLLCGTVWLGKWAQDMQENGQKPWLALPVGAFCAASAWVYALLGMK